MAPLRVHRFPTVRCFIHDRLPETEVTHVSRKCLGMRRKYRRVYPRRQDLGGVWLSRLAQMLVKAQGASTFSGFPTLLRAWGTCNRVGAQQEDVQSDCDASTLALVLCARMITEPTPMQDSSTSAMTFTIF